MTYEPGPNEWVAFEDFYVSTKPGGVMHILCARSDCLWWVDLRPQRGTVIQISDIIDAVMEHHVETGHAIVPRLVSESEDSDG
jgi:hypothetical protein